MFGIMRRLFNNAVKGMDPTWGLLTEMLHNDNCTALSEAMGREWVPFGTLNDDYGPNEMWYGTGWYETAGFDSSTEAENLATTCNEKLFDGLSEEALKLLNDKLVGGFFRDFGGISGNGVAIKADDYEAIIAARQAEGLDTPKPVTPKPALPSPA